MPLLRLLLDNGAAINAQEPVTGWTAFHAACFNNRTNTAAALLRAGCNKSIESVIGKTGRQLAEERRHDEVHA